jgi:hypothetical protein
MPYASHRINFSCDGFQELPRPRIFDFDPDQRHYAVEDFPVFTGPKSRFFAARARVFLHHPDESVKSPISALDVITRHEGVQ